MAEILITLLNTYLLNIYYTPSTALGAGNSLVKKRNKSLCLLGNRSVMDKYGLYALDSEYREMRKTNQGSWWGFHFTVGLPGKALQIQTWVQI